ncbi:MAG: hypothetical protein ACOX88_00750 [Christensenellales bacterium]
MSLANIMWVALLVLIIFDVAPDTMKTLKIKQLPAIGICVLALVLGNLPGFVAGNWLVLNIGWTVVPLAVYIYLFVRTRDTWQRIGSILAPVVLAYVMYILGRSMPDEMNISWQDGYVWYGMLIGAFCAALAPGSAGAVMGCILSGFVAGTSQSLISRMRGIYVPVSVGTDQTMAVMLIAVISALIVRWLIAHVKHRFFTEKTETSSAV